MGWWRLASSFVKYLIFKIHQFHNSIIIIEYQTRKTYFICLSNTPLLPVHQTLCKCDVQSQLFPIIMCNIMLVMSIVIGKYPWFFLWKFEIWSNKVDRKLIGDHCWSNHSARERKENCDLLSYVCFNEFFDLDQLWYACTKSCVCWQIGFFMHKAWIK